MPSVGWGKLMIPGVVRSRRGRRPSRARAILATEVERIAKSHGQFLCARTDCPEDTPQLLQMSFSASPPPPPRGPSDLRYQVGLLRGFEQWGGTWRGALALVRLGADQAVPIAAAVVVALVTVNGRIAQTAISATLALVVNGTTKSLRQKFPSHRPVTSRLALWETVNPRSIVPASVTKKAVAPAFLVLGTRDSPRSATSSSARDRTSRRARA